MAELAWKDNYRINHFQTDEEHKGLIALANKVIAFSNNGEDAKKVKNALIALNSYAENHFRNEEDYMARIGYKNIAHHKKCHAALIDRLNAVVTQSAGMDDLVHQLKRLMVTWVIEHIIHEDKKIVPQKE